jgi:signal transduction histidine kinase
VEIDVDLMNDALENLLSNAIKFTPSGKNIWVGIQATQAYVKIYIKDEGLGIKSEEMMHLFAPFKRLSARPTGNESSTGLGLFIVKRIIELHQGELTAESSGINNGSTFTIQLPLAPINEPVAAE